MNVSTPLKPKKPKYSAANKPAASFPSKIKLISI